MGSGRSGKYSQPYSNDAPVTVQNPLPCDGDSVYVKDLDLDNCSNGDFSGEVSDYFDSILSINSNTTGNDPKVIKLWFKRTVYSHAIGFGCNDLGQGFGTSITIKLLGSGEAVRFEQTFTAVDPNSFLAEFGPRAFNGVLIEFNEPGTVCLSNITIRKASEVDAIIQGQDPSGEIREVQVTQDGYLLISDNSSGLAIAEGEVTGKTFIHKFGNAPSFATGDGIVTIWDAADGSGSAQYQYNYSTAADIDSISSSNVTDTQEIEIQGLDANYGIVSQTVTLSGQTTQLLTIPLLRVFRMKNVNSTDLAGNVFLYVNGATVVNGVPSDPTLIRAGIEVPNNQTLMAIYTVPAGKTAYMRDWYAATAAGNKNATYKIILKAREPNGVFQTKHVSSISDIGTNAYQHKYEEPEVFTEKTDIEMTVELLSTGVSGASISAGFDLVQIDNDGA